MQPRFEDQWRTRFEAFAGSRDDDAGIAGWSATGLDARVRRFRGLWHPPVHGGNWLDAGCGAGTYTRILLDCGQHVVAVDYSLPTLRKTVTRELPGAVFAVADVRSLPFRRAQFDGALCFGVTQALTESRPAIRELASTLKPGGQLWMDALNGWCVIHVWGALRRRLRGRPRHLRYESPREIKRQFRACGFTDIRMDWMPIAPGGSRSLQRLIESAPTVWMLRSIPLLGALVSHAFIIRGTREKGGS